MQCVGRTPHQHTTEMLRKMMSKQWAPQQVQRSHRRQTWQDRQCFAPRIGGRVGGHKPAALSRRPVEGGQWLAASTQRPTVGGLYFGLGALHR